MAKRATAVDIGSHSAKVLTAQEGKHGVSITGFAGLPRGEGDARVSLREAGIPLKDCVCGLAGRDMTLRYSQVPPTPDWQLRNLMDLEIQDLSQQSGGSLSADYNLLPIEDPDGAVETILLALAKDEGLERLHELTWKMLWVVLPMGGGILGIGILLSATSGLRGILSMSWFARGRWKHRRLRA